MDLPMEINGRAVDADARTVVGWGNFGHFTAAQVRAGRTRGLDLHLARLDAANRELFGTGLDPDLVRDRIRHALGEIRDASVRVWSYRGGDLLVIVNPPVDMPRRPHSLRSVLYQRPVPHIKHSGGFAQGYYLDQVAADGYDEALLTDPHGTISEGAITNVGWRDGDVVVWPDAPALAGIAMQVLRRELAKRGVEQRTQPVNLADVAAFDAMFLCNSRGLAPVDRVDDTVLSGTIDGLITAYDEAPQDEI